LESSGEVKKKSVLDVPRQDPNVIEVNKHRETKRCYNCRKTGHLATRYSKPRKERSEEVRIIKEVTEDFSKGKE